MRTAPRFESLSLVDFISSVADRVKFGRPVAPAPAFTLVLGAGFSSPLIPTAAEMVQIDIAWWLHWRQCAPAGMFPAPVASDDLRHFMRQLWGAAHRASADFDLDEETGLPAGGAANVARAYRAVMGGRPTCGLSTPDLRRRYIRDLCQRVGTKINAAHLYLASILSQQERLAAPFCRTILTTNFDPLLQRSLQLLNTLYYMSDRPATMMQPYDDDHDAIHLIYTHGSLHQYSLVNSSSEMQNVATNAGRLSPYLARHGVIVIGYSGWSDATIAALAAAPAFDGNLYWCDLHDPAGAERSLTPQAVELLELHRGNAFYVQIPGADDALAALHGALSLGAVPSLVLAPIDNLLSSLSRLAITSREPDAPRQTASSPEILGPPPAYIDSLADQLGRTIDRLKVANVIFAEPELFSADAATALTRDLRARAVVAKLLTDAITKLQSHEFAAAVVLFDEALATEGVHADGLIGGHVGRAVAFLAMNKNEEAIHEADFVLSMSTSPEVKAMAQYLRAFAHSGARDLSAAVSELSKALEMPSSDVEARALALAMRGALQESSGERQAALADYADFFQIPTKNEALRARVLVSRAEILESTGASSDALDQYWKVLTLPVSPEFHSAARGRIARILHAGGRTAAAASELTQLIDDPAARPLHRMQALLDRSVILDQDGALVLAQQDAAAAVAIPGATADRNAAARCMLALYQIKGGDHAAALEGLSAVIASTGITPAIERYALQEYCKLLMRAGRPADAMTALRRLVELGRDDGPTLRQARLMRSRACCVVDPPDPTGIDDAAAIIADVDSTPRERNLAHCQRAELLERLGRSAEAVSDYVAIGWAPGSEDRGLVNALLGAAFRFSQSGDRAEAIKVLSAAASVGRDFPDLHARAVSIRSFLHSFAGNREASDADIDYLIKIQAPAPYLSYAYFDRGRRQREKGLPKAALRDMVQAFKSGGLPPVVAADVYFSLWSLSLELGNRTKAIEHLTALLNLEDCDAEHRSMALFWRARTWLENGVAESALEDCSALAEVDKRVEAQADILMLRGKICKALGRQEEAEAALSALLQLPDLRPDHRVTALVERATMRQAMGRIDEEIADYTSLAEDSDAPSLVRALALTFRGKAAARMGSSGLPRLISDSRAALGISPELGLARSALALGLSLSGQHDESLREYDSAVASGLKPEEIQDALLELRTAQPDVERRRDAERILQRAAGLAKNRGKKGQHAGRRPSARRRS